MCATILVMPSDMDAEKNQVHGYAEGRVVKRLCSIPESDSSSETELRAAINWSASDRVNVATAQIDGKERYIYYSKPGNYVLGRDSYKITDIVVIADTPEVAEKVFLERLRVGEEIRNAALNTVNKLLPTLHEMSGVPLIIWRGDTAFPDRVPSGFKQDVDLMLFVDELQTEQTVERFRKLCEEIPWLRVEISHRGDYFHLGDQSGENVPHDYIGVVSIDMLEIEDVKHLAEAPNYVLKPYQVDCFTQGIWLRNDDRELQDLIMQKVDSNRGEKTNNAQASTMDLARHRERILNAITRSGWGLP